MNTLIVFPKKEIREVVSFFLEGQFGMEVRSVATVDEAIQSLSNENEAYDLLVCDYPTAGPMLIQYAVSHHIDLHILCAADGIPLDALISQRKQWNHVLLYKGLVQNLSVVIKQLFKEFQSVPPTSDFEFCEINPNLLFHANPLVGAVYVKLSDDKFVRVLLEGVEFDTGDFDYFFKKKQFKALHIKKEQCAIFANRIFENLTKQPAPVNKEPALNPVDAKKKQLEALKAKAKKLQEAVSEVVEVKKTVAKDEKNLEASRAAMIQQRAKEILNKKPGVPPPQTALNKKVEQLEDLKKAQKLEKDLADELDSILESSKGLGFTPEVQAITKKSVLSTIKMVRSSRGLSDLLRQMTQDQGKYIASHSMLLAYLSCAIASQLEWRSDATYQKLTLAAFLHDSTLENHALAAIQTLGELEEKKAKFTEKELKDFRQHPIAAAQIATRFNEVPPDVDSIIAQHHELPNGTGFPRGLSHLRMGPLAAVFIVAHELVSCIFSSSSNVADPAAMQKVVNQFLVDRQQKYQMGNFRKIMAAVAKIRA